MPTANLIQGESFKTGSALVTIILGLSFLIIKFDLIKWVVIEDGQRGLRIRWGNPKVDKKTGEYKILTPGGRRYFYIRVIHGAAIVNIRASASTLGQLRQTFKNRNVLMTMRVRWNIEDTPQSIRNSIFNVNDPDRFDTTNKTLEELVISYTKAAVTCALRTAVADDQGLPVIDLVGVEEYLNKDLRKLYGVSISDLITEEICFAPEQVTKDGMLGHQILYGTDATRYVMLPAEST